MSKMEACCVVGFVGYAVGGGSDEWNEWKSWLVCVEVTPYLIILIITDSLSALFAYR